MAGINVQRTQPISKVVRSWVFQPHMVGAAGDAAANPHFMTASGLTGARENTLNLQNYTKEVSRQWNPKVDKKRRGLAVKKLEEKQQTIGDLVIHRGEAFLGRASIFRRLFGLYRTS